MNEDFNKNPGLTFDEPLDLVAELDARCNRISAIVDKLTNSDPRPRRSLAIWELRLIWLAGTLMKAFDSLRGALYRQLFTQQPAKT